MKNIVIIPARGGSKRLPSKNLKLLGELPLLVHSILYAQKHKDFIDEIYVSTDDAMIKKVALAHGTQVINRPKKLSGDDEPTITALQHVLASIKEEVENVILLQPTNPLRPEHLLGDAFRKFKSINVDSLFTVTKNHHKLGRIVNNGFVPFNYTIGQRSQDLEPLYFENGLLYITKAKLIREGKIFEENSLPYEVKHIFASVDIDTQEDLEYATYVYNKFIIHNL